MNDAQEKKSHEKIDLYDELFTDSENKREAAVSLEINRAQEERWKTTLDKAGITDASANRLIESLLARKELLREIIKTLKQLEQKVTDDLKQFRLNENSRQYVLECAAINQLTPLLNNVLFGKAKEEHRHIDSSAVERLVAVTVFVRDFNKKFGISIPLESILKNPNEDILILIDEDSNDEDSNVVQSGYFQKAASRFFFSSFSRNGVEKPAAGIANSMPPAIPQQPSGNPGG